MTSSWRLAARSAITSAIASAEDRPDLQALKKLLTGLIRSYLYDINFEIPAKVAH